MATAAEPRGFASEVDAVAHVFGDALDEVVVVDGPDGHHLERVRRLRAGEHVTVADGAGAWREYRVTGTARGRLDLGAVGSVRREPRLHPGLGVAFGVGKGSKPEHVVSGLTELGVDRIVPLVTARTVVRWDDDRAGAAVGRLRRIAREAAMQCRRSRVPEVEEPVDVAALRTPGVVVVGDPGGVPAAEVPEPEAGEWTVVVGAEGGLAPEEQSVLDARRGTVRLAVGPHVLRTETAAVAVAAALVGRRRAVPA